MDLCVDELLDMLDVGGNHDLLNLVRWLFLVAIGLDFQDVRLEEE